MSDSAFFPLILALWVQLVLSVMMVLVLLIGFATHRNIRKVVRKNPLLTWFLVATVPWSIPYASWRAQKQAKRSSD